MKVRLHSNDKSAAEATDATIKGLPGGCRLTRDATGQVQFDKDGLATVEGADLNFMAYALRQQGYVREVFYNAR